MAEHQEQHGSKSHGGHGSSHPMAAWMEQHMGGMVHSFGKRFEATAENFMFFIVNGVLLRLAVLCLVIMTPVILVELVLHTIPL